MAEHSIQCTCGSLKGTIDTSLKANHLFCYCHDCQTFARWLERQDEILNQQGGSRIVQVVPRTLRWTEGQENIACMRLSPKGTLRWYTSCCKTPLANTPASPKVPFVGLIHTCLGTPEEIETTFGPIKANVNPEDAIGEPKPRAFGKTGVILGFMGRSLVERMTGRYKQNPFFPKGDDTPLATPTIIPKDQRQTILQAIRSS